MHLSATNVSSGGLFVRSEQPLALGTRLSITLHLPEDGQLDVEGEVVHVIDLSRANANGLAPGFGVRFDPKYATDLGLLAAMAASQEKGRHAYRFDESYIAVSAKVRQDGATQLQTAAFKLKNPEAAGAALRGPATDQVRQPTDDFVAIDVEVDEFRDGDPAAAVQENAPSSPVSDGTPARMRPEDAIFGIDFGTSYTSIALVDGDQMRVLEDEERQTLLPSIVCYMGSGPPLVGWPAREKMLSHPSTTFRSPKRLLGKRFDDRRLESFMVASPVRMGAGPGGQILADVYGSTIAIPQVCSEIFKRVAQIGEKATGIPVRRVVLTAPVGYHDERRAIARAAQLAGLEVIGMVDEPVAAAVAQGMEARETGLIAVYDFGGGTFDFTLLDQRDGRFEIVGVAGDEWLGGDDFDTALAEHGANVFWRQYDVDLRKRAVEWQKLLFCIEAAKRRLSTRHEIEVVAPALLLSLKGPIDLRMRLDRDLFAERCGPLVDRSIDVVDSCLQLLGVRPEQVSSVVLTGGVSRTPLVRERVRDYFRREARLGVDPEHAVVLGAAIYGRIAASANPLI